MRSTLPDCHAATRLHEGAAPAGSTSDATALLSSSRINVELGEGGALGGGLPVRVARRPMKPGIVQNDRRAAPGLLAIHVRGRRAAPFPLGLPTFLSALRTREP